MPAPVPDNVRKLRGNPGKRPEPKRPKAATGIPARASWLDKEAKAEWDRITPELERIGILSQIDRAVLHAYCHTWARWVAVARALDKDGGLEVHPDPTHPDRPTGGLRKHPLWSVYLSLGRELRSAAVGLGLQPDARGRMTVPAREMGNEDGVLD
jgi:P27 family predicted phage terminase small subunit